MPKTWPPPILHTNTAPRSGLSVVVTTSVEPLDFDGWTARYVRAIIALDRVSSDTSEVA